VENVPEFARWVLFDAWRSALRALGYATSLNVVDAADLGVPQHRRRLFIVGTRSRYPLYLKLRHRSHVPAASFIDFDAGEWSPVRKAGRSARTLARIRAGRRAFGDRFLAPYYGSGSGETGRSLERPIGTITTRDRWSVIDGNRMRMINREEARKAMAFPVRYRLPEHHAPAMAMLGNAVPPPMARDVLLAVQRSV
jgi:DNA (cytosine-5)-methyltransferase 1